jgi:uncharacterized membrane protein YraQ (UPF0718 family)
MFALVQQRLPDLLTVFLGIFLEATPFLLVGVLVSSVLETLVSQERLTRWLPQNAVVGLLGGVAVSAAAPLCECGTVPIARSCVSKGLPLPAAIGFLLAAPVINPVTVTATYTAFHSNLQILAFRVTLGIAVALAVGALFLLWPAGEPALRVSGGPDPQHSGHDHHLEHDHISSHSHGWANKFADLLHHSGAELSSLAPYLVVACLVASLLQVFLPRTQLLSVGQGPLLSVLVMMGIAVVLSTCSSVDAFVALAFSSTFAPGAILAFLLISPVLNLKSGALVLGLFRPAVAITLLASSTCAVLLAALSINYHLI